MKIILLQNTIISGDRYVVGQFADVPDALAKKYAESGLARLVHAENAPQEAPDEVQEEAQGVIPDEAFNPVFDDLEEVEEVAEEPQPEPVKPKTTRSRRAVKK